MTEPPDQMTPTGREVSNQYRKRQQIERRRPVLATLNVVSIVIAALFAAWFFGDRLATRAADDARDVAIGQINAQLKNVCKKVPDAELSTQEKDGCVRAEVSPTAVPPSTAVPPPTVVERVDDSRIRILIRGVLAENPPKDGTPGKDAPAVDENALVARVRALIPTPTNGQDAPDPTDARLLGLIRSVLAENPPPAGPSGESPACLQEETKCQGPRGETGERGPDGASCPEGFEFQPAPKLLPTEPDTVVCTAVP